MSHPLLNRLGQLMDWHCVLDAVIVTGNGIKIGMTDEVLIVACMEQQE
jgi:hypothetical protein